MNARQGGAAASHQEIPLPHDAQESDPPAKKPDKMQESDWEPPLWGRPSREGGPCPLLELPLRAPAALGPGAQAWGSCSPACRKVKLRVRAFPRQPHSGTRLSRARSPCKKWQKRSGQMSCHGLPQTWQQQSTRRVGAGGKEIPGSRPWPKVSTHGGSWLGPGRGWPAPDTASSPQPTRLPEDRTLLGGKIIHSPHSPSNVTPINSMRLT